LAQNGALGAPRTDEQVIEQGFMIGRVTHAYSVKMENAQRIQ
jgi:hypothetical protein